MAILHISKKQTDRPLSFLTLKIDWPLYHDQLPDSERWREKLRVTAERHVQAVEKSSDIQELIWIERNFLYFQICWGLLTELNRRTK